MPQPEPRPIKFRLAITSPHWDEDPGSTKLSEPITLEQLIDAYQIDFTDGGYITWDQIDWESDTVRYLQFSGLRDENGKDIYEGDVILLRHETGYQQVDERREAVTFDSGSFSACIYAWPGDNVAECQVIGNIVENPELLTHAQA
jgi:uncharacterized phage protein (TIGR01671 family)